MFSGVTSSSSDRRDESPESEPEEKQSDGRQDPDVFDLENREIPAGLEPKLGLEPVGEVKVSGNGGVGGETAGASIPEKWKDKR